MKGDSITCLGVRPFLLPGIYEDRALADKALTTAGNSLMPTNPRDPADEHRHQIGEDEGPCEATVHAVAQVTDRKPLDLPPLAWTIDPDSLCGLVESSPDARRLNVAFEYADCLVTVTPTEVAVR
jgi:hypothetical protein